MVSAGESPTCGWKVNSHWLGPELDLDRAQRQAERDDIAAHRLEDRLHLVEPCLGQILVALGEQADLGRLARPGRRPPA